MRRPIRIAAIVILLLLVAAVTDGVSQSGTADMPTCVPIAQRTGEVGCWIIVDEPVGPLRETPVFWHLDTFPTRAAAEAARRPGAAVIEALGGDAVREMRSGRGSRNGQLIA